MGWFAVSLAVLLVLWAAAMAVLIGSIWWDSRPPSQIDFDAQVWRDSPGQEIRWRMHKDLLRSGVLEGATEDDVVALLGEDGQHSYYGAGWLEYNMGLEQGLFRIDTVSLVLQFGPDGRLVRKEVWTN
ncbi:hypothetical protein AYO38_03270 [bacterium SCGC AG-212-C10]|nr:hypothetical protein AYO38_03270 [bacterium SCGC AG-212-C10]